MNIRHFILFLSAYLGLLAAACSASEESTNSAAGGDGATANGGAAATGNTASGGATSSVTGSGGATSNTATGGATSTTTSTGTCAKFSFFVTSIVAIRRESGNQNGFGGDLGGLAGADELCRSIAESSLACAGQKTWRAFLSTSTANAIDRVGAGPWYDRNGRLVANTTADLLNERPLNADSAIINDLPNETGTPNHNPDGTGQVDNHDTLTGSNGQGKLYSATATCSDWTSTTATGKPRVGHSWPGGPSRNWMNAMDAEGCAAGVNLTTSMGAGSCVGCGGGYGGFYCFATTP